WAERGDEGKGAMAVAAALAAWDLCRGVAHRHGSALFPGRRPDRVLVQEGIEMKGSLVSRDSRHHTIQRAGVAGGRAIIKGLVASLSAALALLASPGASGIVQGHAQDNFFLFASPALGATYLVGESISVDWACNPEIFIECSSSPSGDALSFILPGTYT